MPDQAEERVRQAIAERVFPGCVVGVVHTDGTPEARAFGNYTYEQDSPRVEVGTIYDLASITKSIPTASLAATFVSEGRLSLVDQVRRYIPELKDDYGATIEDLLRYRVHGPQLSKLPYQTFEEIRTYVFGHGFDEVSQTGVFTNLPAFVLGVVLERVGEKPLDVLADEHFFKPLGMSQTTLLPSNERLRKSFIAPTEGGVHGEVHDESARVFAAAGQAVGHAGLFSTAPDLLKFLGTLLKGKLPHIVDAAQKGLGWQINDANFMGNYTGPRTFGKTGFTGTSIVCDIERGIGFVILSNRTYPKRPQNTRAINAFRRDVADMLLQ